jgi:RNA polymerase sigma-70 factor (ECF subfamily)
MGTAFLTSSTLLERLKGTRDPEAWQRFQRVYSVLMRRWGRDFGLQPGDAADAAQEISLHVFTNIHHFQHRHPGAFRAWLRVIARNKIRHIRRARKMDSLDDLGITDIADMGGGQGFPEEQWNCLLAKAKRAVRPEFVESTWKAFQGVYEERRSPADVANELGMSVNAVYIARSRVLGRLRHQLGRLLEDEAV